MATPGCQESDEKSKMLAGELYCAADAQLTAERERCQALLTRLNALPVGLELERSCIVRQLFGRVPEPESDDQTVPPSSPHLEPTFRCDYGYNIAVGKNFYCNFDCCILDCCAVTIGDDVFFGPRVQVGVPAVCSACCHGARCGIASKLTRWAGPDLHCRASRPAARPGQLPHWPRIRQTYSDRQQVLARWQCYCAPWG